MPVIDGLPVSILAGQVTPRRPGPRPPQHSVDQLSMVGPPAAPARRRVRQQRLQPRPFLISQLMTIDHTDDLPDPTPAIHGTRPRPASVADEAVGGAQARRQL